VIATHEEWFERGGQLFQDCFNLETAVALVP
jgi:hypothetical protein